MQPAQVQVTVTQSALHPPHQDNLPPTYGQVTLPSQTPPKPIAVSPRSVTLLSHLSTTQTSNPVANMSAGCIAASQLQRLSAEANPLSGVVLPGRHPNVVRIAGGRLRTQDDYYRKWRRLKKAVKDIVFVNTSMCDEVIRVEEKLSKAKEERRFLLRKLLQYHNVNETLPASGKSECTSTPKTSKSPVSLPATAEATPESVSKPKAKKKLSVTTTPVAGLERKKTAAPKDGSDAAGASKPKRPKQSSNKRLTIPPLTLDVMGRPLFPIVLNDLTIYSIGEIVCDRPTFHSVESIFPEGYCSTRMYASTIQRDQTCLYTCKISDVGPAPIFEIAPEDCPENPMRGKSPSDCHSLLLKAINSINGADIVPTVGNGCNFFGLTHPVIQNLIQSCPGARKCSSYKWMRFEVNKNVDMESISHCQGDPTISFNALKVLTTAVKPVTPSLLEPSTSLRSLLTSGPFAAHKMAANK